MTEKSLLLVAHPGHELLLYGWLRDTRPTVCILTDGSGHDAASRVGYSEALLRSVDAEPGPVFGRFTDREMYALLLAGDAAPFLGIAVEVMQFISANGITHVVADSMEGFNPVHDLCRSIAGFACQATRIAMHEEYPIDRGPHAFDGAPDATHRDIDDATLREKLTLARRMTVVIPDIVSMFDRHEMTSFRRESLRPVADWRQPGWPVAERPQYETIGEERVAAGRYRDVIRYHEHVEPIVRLLSTRVGQLLCAS